MVLQKSCLKEDMYYIVMVVVEMCRRIIHVASSCCRRLRRDVGVEICVVV